jgi:hypothetical protein
MKRTRILQAGAVAALTLLMLCTGNDRAQTSGKTQLTIYNQDFAVVKEMRNIELKSGETEFRADDVTARLDPTSVILLDVKDPDGLKIMEQNYESEPVSQGLLLKKFEGKEVIFEIFDPNTKTTVQKKGKVIRSGYSSQSQAYYYGYDYNNPPVNQGSPIIEIEGKTRFGLPGTPLFEGISSDSFLKPTLLWKLWAKSTGKHLVEFSYITGGLKWDANYNMVFPEKGSVMDMIGWVTIDNKSGKEFKDSSIKLMAGDVNRAQQRVREMQALGYSGGKDDEGRRPPQVTEKAFDEFHLYNLNRQTTVRDNEVKQVEFLRANKAAAEKIFIYDGANYWLHGGYGENANKKVWAMVEFKNSEKNHLGMPMPKGKIKVYRQDDDGRNEFIGEDFVDHTPKDETVKIYIGNSFDVVGERKQTNYVENRDKHFADETFEISIRNHKKEAVEVRVVEHLYRWNNWEIKGNSDSFEKTDAFTVQFKVNVGPDKEKKITYTAHYSW